jgi:hypothetical protein
MATIWVLTVSRLALISFRECLVLEMRVESAFWLAVRFRIAAFCAAMSFWSSFCRL